jgi:AcrR family transcriptional regulator
MITWPPSIEAASAACYLPIGYLWLLVQQVTKAIDNLDLKLVSKRIVRTHRSPRKRRRLAPEEREREILDGAVRFFAEVGFDGRLRDLAKRLGITHQNLFRYFPTKEALIERVYQEVYLGKWQPEWENLLRAPDRPLELRLSDFYKAYVRSIYSYEWVRIFVFAGLKGVGISQRYLPLIQKKVIVPLAVELRLRAGVSKPLTLPPSADELEIAWGLHGEIFYLGIRRWVYDLPVPDDLDRLIDNAIATFLGGAPHTIRLLLKEKSSPREKKWNGKAAQTT